MALTWITVVEIDNAGGGHDGQVELVTVNPGSTLKRVIIQWYINVSTSDSAVLGTWTGQGVLSLIEATTGDPAPAPDVIGDGAYNSRDILETRYAGVGWSGVFSNLYRVPDISADVIIQDTPVQRRADADEIKVWWNWGLLDFGGAGVEVGFHKIISRVLIDTP